MTPEKQEAKILGIERSDGADLYAFVEVESKSLWSTTGFWCSDLAFFVRNRDTGGPGEALFYSWQGRRDTQLSSGDFSTDRAPYRMRAVLFGVRPENLIVSSDDQAPELTASKFPGRAWQGYELLCNGQTSVYLPSGLGKLSVATTAQERFIATDGNPSGKD